MHFHKLFDLKFPITLLCIRFCFSSYKMVFVSLYLATGAPVTKFWFSLYDANAIFLILSFDALIMFISLGSLAINFCSFLIGSSSKELTCTEI